MNPDNSPVNSNVQTNQASIPSFIDNVTSQFIVTPITPNTIGVSGYIFDIIGNEDIVLDSEITDSYTETNTSYQDQIAIRPEQFTLSGYVGELVNDIQNPFTAILTAANTFGLTLIGPTFNAQDEQFYDQQALVAASAVAVINTAQNIYSLFGGYSTTATKQQNAFQYFYNLWLSRTLCEVETPWGVLENMAILNVRARQDETTRLVSDFSVTFKAMRFASTSPTTAVNGTDLSTTSPQATQVLQTSPSTGGISAGTVTPSSTISTYGTNLSSKT